MSRRFTFYLLTSLLASLAPLSASTIFTIPGTIQSSQYTVNGYEYAISFIASANETVTGGSIVGSGGLLTMAIEANSGGQPSNTALTGGTATVNLSNPAMYTAVSGFSANLTMGAEYWIVLSSSTASINLSSSAAGTVSNVTGEWTSNGGGTWTTEGSGSGYYLPDLTLSGNVPAALPESGTAGLALTAIALLAAFRWRLRHSNPALEPQ